MPKYFFHVYHDRINIDQSGYELPDKHSAWATATKTAGEMLKDLDGDLKPGREWRMVVEDELRQALFTLTISASQN